VRVDGALTIDLCGESLVLLAERAAYRPARETLLVADPHFGKGAAFRAHGFAVPGGTTAETLARLGAAVEQTGARRIVFLGDFFHARAGRAAGDPPPELGIEPCDGPCAEPPFAYAHHPVRSPDGYVLAGHLHPSVTLRGAGRQRQRFPCFHIGAGCGVLPAFGDFTGTAEVRVHAGDRLYVVAGEEVLAIRSASEEPMPRVGHPFP
jgi:uncharacterized protein